MKRLLTLAALATIASGCNSPNHLEGTLSLNERIEIRTKFLGRDSKHEVPTGSYNTSLALSNSGGSVRIHASDGILSFSAPSIRADQYGKFRLSPEELGQSFALEGIIDVKRNDFDRVVRQACVHHYNQDYQCRPENQCITEPNGHVACGINQRCEWVEIPVYGKENVHEIGYEDIKFATIQIIQNGRTSGTFGGSYSYNEHISHSNVISNCTL